LGSESNLEGQGATSRSNTLTATLTARVVEVLPNGYLVLEGSKDVQANSERQKIVVRGVARWNDIGPGNTLRSDRLGQMEIRIDGKGVVADAIRRPNLLYRILLGILPF
jgi:flagellar L-ring protein precursor FlgH